jgi:hypothetical protein
MIEFYGRHTTKGAEPTKVGVAKLSVSWCLQCGCRKYDGTDVNPEEGHTFTGMTKVAVNTDCLQQKPCFEVRGDATGRFTDRR